MLKEEIQLIHEGPFRLVFVSSGGGSKAISDLLKVPGASQTILECHIPYSRESMDEYLNFKPSHYCGLQTTVNMAVMAFSRAKKLSTETKPENLIGVAVTATLSTTYEKLGSHRFFICIHGYEATHVFSCYLTKGKRTRDHEEELVSECLESLIGIACGLGNDVPSLSQQIDYEVVSAKDDWHALEKKEIDYLGSWDESKKLIFPGTFNPLHEGHRKIQKIAEDQLQIPVTFEISISNVEKTYLSYYEIDKTIKQFKEDKNWVMTNAPSFSQKSEIFKDSTFIIGMDTLLRIFDKRYYKDAEDMESSLNSFISNNSQFMVFGRKIDGHFMTLNDIQIPENLKNHFEFVSETDFRVDLSSSEIKRNAEANKILT